MDPLYTLTYSTNGGLICWRTRGDEEIGRGADRKQIKCWRKEQIGGKKRETKWNDER